MVLDSDLQTIYIFGGKILNNNASHRSEAEYSGLYKYHIPSNVWTVLKPDNDPMLRLAARLILNKTMHYHEFYTKVPLNFL